MGNLIISNDNHNVLLRNAYLEDKQLNIKNKNCVKSLQRSKMLGPRLEKFFEDNFFY